MRKDVWCPPAYPKARLWIVRQHIKGTPVDVLSIYPFRIQIEKHPPITASKFQTIENLEVKPNLTLIDGNFAPKGLKNYKTIVNGDEKIKVISAASIIAKVYRDRFMIRLSEKFSNYAWERNFGYGTKAHLEGLKKFGVTSHHRKDFKPIHKILSS